MAPLVFEPEVFRKQMHCSEESTCNIVETSRRPGNCAPSLRPWPRTCPLLTPVVANGDDTTHRLLSGNAKVQSSGQRVPPPCWRLTWPRPVSRFFVSQTAANKLIRHSDVNAFAKNPRSILVFCKPRNRVIELSTRKKSGKHNRRILLSTGRWEDSQTQDQFSKRAKTRRAVVVGGLPRHLPAQRQFRTILAMFEKFCWTFVSKTIRLRNCLPVASLRFVHCVALTTNAKTLRNASALVCATEAVVYTITQARQGIWATPD